MIMIIRSSADVRCPDFEFLDKGTNDADLLRTVLNVGYQAPVDNIKALFYDEMQKRVRELSDPQKTVSTLHIMKGSAAVMQFERLKNFLSELHNSCKHHGHELTALDFEHLHEMLSDEMSGV